MNLWVIISLLVALGFVFNNFADNKNESTVTSQIFQSTGSMVQKGNVIIPSNKTIKNYGEKSLGITLEFKGNAKIVCKDEKGNDMDVYPVITRYSSDGGNSEIDLYQPYNASGQTITSNEFYLDLNTKTIYQYSSPISELRLYNSGDYEKINIMYNQYCFIEIKSGIGTPLEINNIEKITTKNDFGSGGINNYNVNGNNLFFNIVE